VPLCETSTPQRGAWRGAGEGRSEERREAEEEEAEEEEEGGDSEEGERGRTTPPLPLLSFSSSSSSSSPLATTSLDSLPPRSGGSHPPPLPPPGRQLPPLDSPEASESLLAAPSGDDARVGAARAEEGEGEDFALSKAEDFPSESHSPERNRGYTASLGAKIIPSSAAASLRRSRWGHLASGET